MRGWRGEQGAAWAERNPSDVAGTDESWTKRFGIEKSVFLRGFLQANDVHTDWLEVGCATGAHMRTMEAAGQRCAVGVDLSHDAVKRAGRACVASASALPFRSGSFGGVTTSGTLMHVGPWETLRDVVLPELVRVAREWVLCMEVHKPLPMIVGYADLMPQAWVYPWGLLLPQMLKGWRKVDAVTLPGTEERYGKLDVVLMRRIW